MLNTELLALGKKCNDIEAMIAATLIPADRFRLRGDLQSVKNAIALLSLKIAVVSPPKSKSAGS